MIDVTGLTKRYDGRAVVEDLTFRLTPGAITGFLGPNGAGKTTTMRMMLGLVRPDAGSVRVDGRPYASLPEPIRTVGASLDQGALHPRRSARDHLLIHAAAGGIDRGRVGEVLEQVGLADAARRRAGGFSLGMRQRLALATALLGEPRALLLDEPANGLDPAGIRWLRTLLRSQADAGTTVLVSSHLLAEVATIADEVIVIDRGRLITHGPIDELTKDATDLEDLFFQLTERQVI